MMILADIFMYVLLNKEIYSLALYIVVLLGPMGDQYYSEWVTLLSSIYVHNFICIYLIIINILLLLLLLYPLTVENDQSENSNLIVMLFFTTC